MKKLALFKIMLVLLFSTVVFIPQTIAQQNKLVQTSAQKEITAKVVVESLYKWHFSHKQQFSKQTYSQKQNWFTPELWQLITKDWKLSASNPGEVVGLDFDPITAAQEEASKYKIGDETPKDDKKIVEVSVYFGTETKQIKFILAKAGSNWQIANIVYSNNEKDDLISIFKETQSQAH